MRFNRNYTVQSDVAATRSHLVTGMNLMQYRLVAPDPLRFERGSFWGGRLSSSPVERKCDVTIELKQVSQTETAVNLSINVPQLPAFVFSGYSMEIQSTLDFWMRELDLIESASKGNMTGLETNLNFAIAKATREYYGYIAMTVVAWGGAIGIALVLWKLGILNYDLSLTMLLVMLGLAPVPVILGILFRLRRKNSAA